MLSNIKWIALRLADKWPKSKGLSVGLRSNDLYLLLINYHPFLANSILSIHSSIIKYFLWYNTIEIYYPSWIQNPNYAVLSLHKKLSSTSSRFQLPCSFIWWDHTPRPIVLSISTKILPTKTWIVKYWDAKVIEKGLIVSPVVILWDINAHLRLSV